VNAASVHSERGDRDVLIKRFREDDIQVMFTVDLFNEGVDFPNVRVLLFLRPTESKTVFLQQLGRGLRLCAGKDRVRILTLSVTIIEQTKIRKFLAKAATEATFWMQTED
jgi:superfamily II DNA or RNA helicase